MASHREEFGCLEQCLSSDGLECVSAYFTFHLPARKCRVLPRIARRWVYVSTALKLEPSATGDGRILSFFPTGSSLEHRPTTSPSRYLLDSFVAHYSQSHN